MKNQSYILAVALYGIGAILMLCGFMNATLGDTASGCEAPIRGTCLILSGNAAALVKIGSLMVITGWFFELLSFRKHI